MSSPPTDDEVAGVEGTRTLPLDGLDDGYRVDCGDTIEPILICLGAAKLLGRNARFLV